MSAARPNPDELLRRVEEEERRAKRGKLTIFFGAAPGVGKTYAMLEAARTERDLRRDVVVGIVETHGRYDTAALTIGLELLPRRKVPHGKVVLEEFDIDAALARQPGIVLVDELAHTNAPGSRHPKRWQDVEELLDAGIDVYTTVNVQHIESLNDVIAQITGVVVRETVPDKVLEEANEIRLIDLPADELLERLGEGKVYVPEQARRALENFFRKGNLVALRELALRETAERVDDQVQQYKRAQGAEQTWPVRERILVCVSPSPESARLIRAARRMATGLRAEWIAAYVETPAALRMNSADRERVAQNIQLAEQLGAETVRLAGESAAEEVIHYARTRNVTKIVVGKPTHARWRDIVRPSFLEEIVRHTPDIEVDIIAGEGTPSSPSAVQPSISRPTSTGFLAAFVVVALSAALAGVLFGRSNLPDVVMVFLLGIVVVSVRYGYGPSIVAAVLSVISFDFFFVPPYLSFAVSDFQHIVTFTVMFIVAVVISNLTKRIRDQADTARQREMRTAKLYALSRELANTAGYEPLLPIIVRHLREAFDARAALLSPGPDSKLEVAATGQDTFVLEGNDREVAEWVWRHEKPAGPGTDTLPSASALFVPLRGLREKVGVLAIKPANSSRLLEPEQRQLLDLFVNQAASALERAQLAEAARRAHVQAETERLRSSLLSSVSHDLRTPLGVITGAASTLEDEAHVDTEARRELVATIREEAERLNRLVRNLLDMTRLESGALEPKLEWHPFEEVVGVALQRLESILEGRAVNVALAPDLPPVPMDVVLVEQLLINLLENAAKHTPAGMPIAISAVAEPGGVRVEIADRGPGIPPQEREHIFEKFYRLRREGGDTGAGLGLAICRGVVEAHGGRIWVEEREGGGAKFCFTLPIKDAPPEIAG